VKTRVEVVGEKDVSVDMNEGKEFTWECTVTSDPSTPPRVKWSKETEDGYRPLDEEPPALLLKDGTLKIHVVPNNKNQSWQTYLGKYRCDGENGYTNESAYVVLRIKDFLPPGNPRCLNTIILNLRNYVAPSLQCFGNLFVIAIDQNCHANHRQQRMRSPRRELLSYRR